MPNHFLKVCLTLLLLVCSLVLSGQPSGYVQLVWSDEFEQNGAPDPAHWAYDIGTGDNGWGNREVQYYTDESTNVRVENGRLIIDARKSGDTWTSARVKTQGKQSFRYGKVVFRAKLPAGSGTWPALWMLGSNFPSVGWPACGEIDVMEHVGKDPGVVHGTLHTPASYGNSQNSGSTSVGDFSTAFHEYAVIWEEDRIRFLVDDTEYYQYVPPALDANNWPFDKDFFIIMNIAMGGNWGSDQQYETGGLKNGIDPALSLARMEVDYVRVFTEFTGMEIEGPQYLRKGQSGIEFRSSNVAGAAYTWYVPDGVTITSGADTYAIVADWGNTFGEVVVEADVDGALYYDTLTVSEIVEPSTAYSLNIGSDQWVVPATFADNLQVLDNAGTTLVQFDVATPNDNPYAELRLSNPVDIRSVSRLQISLSTTDPPNTLRVDLLDQEGNVSVEQDLLFRLDPLNTDGTLHNYIFYFGGLYDSPAAVFDAVQTLRFYTNYGALASPASGQYTLHNVVFDLPADAGVPQLPAAPAATWSETAEQVILTWTDNAVNESFYTVYRKSASSGDFVVLGQRLPVDTEQYVDRTSRRGAAYEYRISVSNQFGEHVLMDDVFIQTPAITAIPDNPDTDFRVFPNPAGDVVSMTLPGASAFEVRICNLTGQTVYQQALAGSTLQMSTAQFEEGVYIVHIRSAGAVLCKRLVVRR